MIRRHRRLTLAVTRVRAHQSMLEVADRLRQRVAALGIALQVDLLDRQLRWLVSAVWKALRFTTWISPQS